MDLTPDFPKLEDTTNPAIYGKYRVNPFRHSTETC